MAQADHEVRNGQKVIIIEASSNSNAHAWNTRLDDSKYESYAANLQSALREMMPDVTIFQNRVPKEFIFSDNYMQLIPGGENVFEMIPRMWAFEVSTVIIDEKTIGGKKVPIKKDILLYSKLMCRTWPHCSSLAKRIARMYDEYEQANGD